MRPGPPRPAASRGIPEHIALASRARFLLNHAPTYRMPRLFALIFLVVVAAGAQAAHFLPVEEIDVRRLLPPPPAPDSLVQQAELTVLYQLQLNRTPAQVKRAHEIQEEDLFSFGAEIFGSWFTAANLPKTTTFFKAAGDDFYAINRASKSLWKRPRPPFADARIQPCVEFSDSPSYPSGHAIQAGMWAILLTELFPDHAAAIQTRTAATGWFRLVAGAHFPTDIEAGRILGEAIAHAFLQDPKFQAGLAEVRAELAPFLQKKAA